MTTATNVPVQEPIPGREALNNPTEPRQALAQFYRAFNARNIALMEENWSGAEDVSMDNPLGGIKRGWAEIRAVYERIFTGRAKVQVEFYDYTLHLIGEVFYAVGRERGWYEGETTGFNLPIRTTRV